MRKEQYKCKTLKIHLKLRDEQLETILFIYRLLHQNLMGTTKNNYNRYKQKKKQSKHITKHRHRIIRKEEGNRSSKTNQKVNKMVIRNFMSYVNGLMLQPKDTDWLTRYTKINPYICCL